MHALIGTICSGRFIEYVLDRPDVQPVWQKFTHHEFVEGLGQGTLPLDRFKEYLVQDYLYLVSSFATLPLLQHFRHKVLNTSRFNSPEATHLPLTKQRRWTR